MSSFFWSRHSFHPRAITYSRLLLTLWVDITDCAQCPPPQQSGALTTTNEIQIIIFLQRTQIRILHWASLFRVFEKLLFIIWCQVCTVWCNEPLSVSSASVISISDLSTDECRRLYAWGMRSRTTFHLWAVTGVVLVENSKILVGSWVTNPKCMLVQQGGLSEIMGNMIDGEYEMFVYWLVGCWWSVIYLLFSVMFTE